MSSRGVVLDANVLFPFTLRDTLLRAAAADLYRLCWSAQILEEMRRNLVKTGTTDETQAARLVSAMTTAFPEAMIEGHEPLVDAMPNHEGDRHVAAAAVHAGAECIVTANLRHFRVLPEGVEARSPDRFLCDLYDREPERLLAIVRRQAEALKKPPRTFEDVLRGLSTTAPRFAERLRAQDR